MKLAALAWVMLQLLPAPVSILVLEAGPTQIDRGGTPVNLSRGGQLTLVTLPTNLTTICGGLRKKTVASVPGRVYVAQLLVDTAHASAFQKTVDGALNSTDAIPTVALHLSFDRDLDASQLSGGLKDALAVNGIELAQDASLLSLANIIQTGAPIKAGRSAVIVTRRVDGHSDAVTYQDPAGKVTVVSGASGLKHRVLSAWLGKPADGGVRALKNQLLGLEPRADAVGQTGSAHVRFKRFLVINDTGFQWSTLI